MYRVFKVTVFGMRGCFMISNIILIFILYQGKIFYELTSLGIPNYEFMLVKKAIWKNDAWLLDWTVDYFETPINKQFCKDNFYYGQTTLAIASCWSRYELVDRLIKLGANPNIPDNFGRTPLIWALEHAGENGTRAKKCIHFLLKAGANANITVKPFAGSYSPLVKAANTGADYVDILITAGAKVDFDAGGLTALQHIVQYGTEKPIEIESLKTLIKHMANTNIKDETGQTPKEHARKQKKMIFLSILEQGQ